jgi:uncharacterized membrane protein YbhN (UPF0104 family)
MENGRRECGRQAGRRNSKRALVDAAGMALGAVFLWLATRHIDLYEIEKALRGTDLKWPVAGVASYLAAIGLRRLRWVFSRASYPETIGIIAATRDPVTLLADLVHLSRSALLSLACA